MAQESNNGQSQQDKSTDMKEFNILFPETREVEVGTRAFTISRFSLRQQKVFMDSVGEVAGVITERPEMLEDLTKHLPELLGLCFDQFIKICAAAVGETASYVENNFDLLGLTRVMVAAFELNDIQEVIKNLQSLWRATGLTLPTVPSENETA